ncbi:MazG family protein [Bailinhaonella thermotolerans]|uniref:MazG family protein n=1 Tax=Bailinhaonella thermotolerans TaxID=1070861 RepID=A0A3A4B4Q1_9ACTN|nr:MazG family protein [Bailinhaonella thermotolerans]RJL33297.1 MazG family protein [Bailinhaonella thermotolerans]
MPLTIVSTSHRVAPGLLTRQAWRALESARVLTATPDHPQLPYLAEAGVEVQVVDPDPHLLVNEARAGAVTWLASPEGDEDLMRRIGEVVVNSADPPDVELLNGSYDVPGARLLDLVEVMDRLRRDCPWDAKQTHESLARHLLEEPYEALEALETGDYAALREELGDVLLQVFFHARIAAEREDETAFDIDDVAAGIVDKLIRRHPHVFSDVEVASPEEVKANWDAIKAAERAAKHGETGSTLDGVPMSQPALALAYQMQKRAERADVPDELYRAVGNGIGKELFDLVRRAAQAGLDPETELRAAARTFRDRVRRWESTRS